MANQSLNHNSAEKDLRKYALKTNTRLVLWFVGLLLTVGLGLIWLLYGRNAALLGFFCLLGASIPITLITTAILGLDYFLKKTP